MKLLHTTPANNGSMTFFLPKGQYGSFLIRYNVVAAAGVTLTRADFGNTILKWNGDDIINVDSEILNLLDDVYGGTAEFVSNAGATAKMSTILTCGEWFDSQNVYDVGDNDRVYFKLDFPVLADSSKVASGSVSVYAKNKSGIMNYTHNIIPRPVVASGASTLADSYPVNNVAQIYLKNPGALLDSIQITKDGLTIVDSTPDVLISYSDFVHRLETTNNTLAIDFVESLDVREAIGATVSYNYKFSGAGTLEQYFSYINFTPKKQTESVNTAVSDSKNRIGTVKVGQFNNAL